MTQTQRAIIAEIYTALVAHKANAFLLGIVGSIEDTLDDESVLAELIEYNRKGKDAEPTPSDRRINKVGKHAADK